ncbi:hypothetical protein RJ55_03191 [Drechmeria coniospora]|nr:hypothetical protein RJ55_03191 [Drechmeria coniospora]
MSSYIHGCETGRKRNVKGRTSCDIRTFSYVLGSERNVIASDSWSVAGQAWQLSSETDRRCPSLGLLLSAEMGGVGMQHGGFEITNNRREKVYCDKWIHEGVCAFTQQGCRYKHVMPLDEPTQRSLGLFQGFPTWWRKQDELANTSVERQAQRPRQTSISCRESMACGEMNPLLSRKWRERAQKEMWVTSASPRHKQSYIRRLQSKADDIAPCIWGPIGRPVRAKPVPGDAFSRDHSVERALPMRTLSNQGWQRSC